MEHTAGSVDHCGGWLIAMGLALLPTPWSWAQRHTRAIPHDQRLPVLDEIERVRLEAALGEGLPRGAEAVRIPPPVVEAHIPRHLPRAAARE